MCTTFVLHVLTNYLQEKRYFRSNVKNGRNQRKIFASLFSGPGELLGKSPPGKSKPRHVFIIEHSILCKNFKTLALKVTEEIASQNDTLKIRKSSISPPGSDVITRKIIFGLYRPIYTIPENFMKVRPGVFEKWSKKKKKRIIIIRKRNRRITIRSSVGNGRP